MANSNSILPDLLAHAAAASPSSELDLVISNVDFVQCMGIEHDGHQGEPFDKRVLGQIKELRKQKVEGLNSIKLFKVKSTVYL